MPPRKRPSARGYQAYFSRRPCPNQVQLQQADHPAYQSANQPVTNPNHRWRQRTANAVPPPHIPPLWHPAKEGPPILRQKLPRIQVITGHWRAHHRLLQAKKYRRHRNQGQASSSRRPGSEQLFGGISSRIESLIDSPYFFILSSFLTLSWHV